MAIIIKDNRVRDIINLSRRAFGRYKWQIVILTVLGFISGLLEGIGINAIIPLFSFVIGGGAGEDFISRAIRQFFAYFGITFNLTYLLIFIATMFILKALVLGIFSYIKIIIDTDYEERTRNDLFRATIRAAWPHVLRQKLGHLETILINDVTRGGVLLRQIGATIMIVSSLLMYIAVAVNISLYITLLTLILGALFFLVFKPLLYKTRMAAYRTAETNKNVAHFVSENVLGMKTVKSMFVGDHITAKGREYFKELKKLKITVFWLSSLADVLMQPLSLVFISIIFVFSYRAPDFNFASLVAIIYLIQKIFQYIQQLQGNAHSINEAIPYLKSVLEHQEKSTQYAEADQGREHFAFNRSLEFRAVSFAYEPGRNILAKVDFSIAKGEMVGLIGGSGAGKTTIVDLLLRLFNPGSGDILLDGKDIFSIRLPDWRKNIGYVSQDIFLMNDTIANNIKFYDQSITKDKVEKAAKMANIYDFVQKCPAGLETIIGERGIMLSAGQRQRIIIARVLARDPKILILDEATSALDNESEAKIQKVIESLKGKITVLAIAHRLSTLRNSDKLMVLDKGKIIEQGKPMELLKEKESYFYKMYNIRQ